MRFVLVVVALLAGCGRRNFNDGRIDAGEPTDGASDASGDWALPGWTARQPVTITLPTGGRLTDFPVLVRLINGTSDFGRMAADGHDLRFVDENGAVLAHDIERFTTVSAAIWVKVPVIDPGVDVALTMYHGNAAAPDLRAQYDQTWDSSFHGVFHMGDVVEDASREHNAANVVGPTLTTGVVGNGRSFTAAGDRIVVGSTGFPTGGDDRSVCAWANPTLFDGNTHYLVGYGLPSGNDGFFLARANTGMVVGSTADQIAIPDTFASRWDHYCVTLDNSSVVRVYMGGALVHSSVHPNYTTMSSPSFIGSFGSGSWVGDLDEVRISDVARGPAWIAAEARVVTMDVARFGATEPP